MKKFNVLDRLVVRSMSHANSNRKIVSRTKEDNKELGEVAAQTFSNRKGNNPTNTNDDIIPAMSGKRPVKPNKGMRKLKGAKSIRKENEDTILAEELKSYDKLLSKENVDD